MSIIKKIHTICSNIKWTVIHSIDSLYWLIKGNSIVVTCWIDQFCGKVTPHNFGDDINVPIIEELTGKKLRAYKTLLNKNQENLICIGSMIENHSNPNAIIWGAGILYGDREIKNGNPKKVLAVRGKKTRDFLMQRGIDCPEIFGDPALLLPLIYTPIFEKKYKYGIIPHYLDYNLPHLHKFIDSHPDCILIDLAHYDSWKSVIDQICCCEMIISSSLHGMITSDAYQIPNMRAIFSNRINGGDFKYEDYCSGVNRSYEPPANFTNIIDVEIAEKEKAKYRPISFSSLDLLKVFPYKLVGKFSNINK